MSEPAVTGTYTLRGAIAAMAMTGMRVVTTGLGLLPKPPPDEIFEDAVPQLLEAVPPPYRETAVELAHWGYGAAGGVGFALLPSAARRHPWAGPVYGVATWALFEAVLAPLLGLRKPPERSPSERAAVIADHVLYGLVVAGRPRRS